MLRLQNIWKKYPDFSLKDVCLEVEKGDYFVLLGKSGSGKSMLLEIIAGIRKQDKGIILLNDKDISKTKIQSRNILLVYQDTALFPHMTVYENIAFTLKNHKFSRKDIKSKIKDIATYVSVEHILHRMPPSLSGGEAQRAALARALVVKPDILLLDEPLSSLDIQMKSGLRSLLHMINQAGQTIIHVTHDFEETLALSNKVAVIDNGQIIQTGSTEEVFQNPGSEFVAGMSGIKNFFKATMSSDIIDDGLRMVQPNGSDMIIRMLANEYHENGYLTFSSKDVFLSAEKTDTSVINNFKGVVVDMIPCGYGMEVIVDIGIKVSVMISGASFRELAIQKGKTTWIGLKASACTFIPLS